MSQGWTPPPPPGWYEPSERPGLLAYWNGSDWDHSVPPQPLRGAIPQPPTTGTSTLEILGWVAVVVFPIVGFAIGIVLAAKDEITKGVAMMGAAVCLGLFWATFLL